MARLLILGPTYGGSTLPGSLLAIERYGGPLYGIARGSADEVEERGVVVATEDLEVITPEAKLPRKPSAGSMWRTLPPITMGSESIERPRSRVLEVVGSEEYDGAFVALNKHYRQPLPDLTPYTKNVIADLKELGTKALKEWLFR